MFNKLSFSKYFSDNLESETPGYPTNYRVSFKETKKLEKAHEALECFMADSGYDLTLDTVKVTLNYGEIGKVKQANRRIFTDNPKVLRAVREALYIMDHEFSDYIRTFIRATNPIKIEEDETKVIVDKLYALGAYHKDLVIDLPTNLDNPRHIWALAVKLYQYQLELGNVMEKANTNSTVQDTSYELY